MSDSNPGEAAPETDSSRHIELLEIFMEEFIGKSVIKSLNPSRHGFHYGPIPNANLRPTENMTVFAKAQSPRYIKRLKTKPGPVPGIGHRPSAVMSKQVGNVCHIAVGNGQMCGKIFECSADVHQHAHTEHPGAIQDTRRVDMNLLEAIRGIEAIKYWILTGQWAKAKYANEPGLGGEVIAGQCDCLEIIALLDKNFAKKWGTTFHRPGIPRRSSDGLSLAAPRLEEVVLRVEGDTTPSSSNASTILETVEEESKQSQQSSSSS